MSILLAGFLLGLSLIIAIGPQNAYIIKMGVKRDHISAIILACLLSDVILINAGVGGMGVLVEKFPTGLVIMKYLGAAYLLYFGFSCFRDAFKKEQEALVVENTQPTVQPQSVHGSTAVITAPRLKSRTWLKPVMGAMALTWLNPLTYVDVLVMLGGIAQQYGQQRWLLPPARCWPVPCGSPPWAMEHSSFRLCLQSPSHGVM
ncbi:lysE type translocator family protein [Corynebacterium simulans]|nr:lysE type translocator family protein [Corynebacterium simulans]